MHASRGFSRLQAKFFYGLLFAAIVATQLWRTRLTTGRWFCVDEFEHLHAAWCTAQGMVPYRDFFEHHSPLLYVVLAPILQVMKPETSYDAAIHAFLLCRWIMWAIGGFMLYLIFRLGREMHSRAVGMIAVLFTLSTMMFIDRSTEIRPDMLSVPAMLGALILTMRAIRAGSPRPIRTMAIAGLLAGLAILASPKSIFWILGFAPAVLWAIADRRLPWNWRYRLKILAAFAAGAAAPMLLTLAAAAALGAAADFIHYNFILNAHWKFRLDPWHAISDLAYENPPLAALGFVGLLHALVDAFRRHRPSRLIPAAALLSLIAGIFIIPVPFTEYFMMPIPLLAIYEAEVIVDASSFVKRFFFIGLQPFRRRENSLFFLYAALAALAMVLGRFRPPVIETRTELAVWIAAIGLILIASFLRRRYVALLLLLAMMTLFPLRRFQTLFALSNQANRQSMAFVYAHSAPQDTVFDGWKGITAPFRPHAWYYFFLHKEIRLMVPQQAWEDLRRGLEDGTIRPKLVVMDEDTLAIPDPAVVQYFRDHYEPGGVGDIWVRRLPHRRYGGPSEKSGGANDGIGGGSSVK